MVGCGFVVLSCFRQEVWREGGLMREGGMLETLRARTVRCSGNCSGATIDQPIQIIISSANGNSLARRDTCLSSTVFRAAHAV